MNRRFLFSILIIAGVVCGILYYRSRHFARTSVSFQRMTDPFMIVHGSDNPSHPPDRHEATVSHQTPPNPIRSANIEHTLQTIQEVKQINKLNQDQNQKHSSTSDPTK